MLISVEGNIGSGKSTVLSLLDAEGWVTKQEPVDDWGEMLSLYYKDPVTWSLGFNLKVLHSFQSIPAGDLVLVERSPGACRHVFGQLSYNDEHLSPASWDVFKGYYEHLGWEPDMYIYIDTPADQCMARLQERGRSCEQNLTLEYLHRIEFQYQNFMKFTETPVHQVSGSQPIPDVVRDITKIISSVL